jgi:hypothetical protein
MPVSDSKPSADLPVTLTISEDGTPGSLPALLDLLIALGDTPEDSILPASTHVRNPAILLSPASTPKRPSKRIARKPRKRSPKP